jgi:hypothetical protein
MNMQYSLWSRDRLLGETDLGFIYRENGFRCGWFHPNELGERLMPVASGVAPALRLEFMIGPDATAHADVLAAVDREEALALELRGPDGERIETESIAIIDTHYLLSIPDNDLADEDESCQLTAEQEAEIDAFVEEWNAQREEWRSEENVEFPRYQIQIQLVDKDACPPSGDWQ